LLRIETLHDPLGHVHEHVFEPGTDLTELDNFTLVVGHKSFQKCGLFGAVGDLELGVGAVGEGDLDSS